MYYKDGVQGRNYYVSEEIEKFRYNPYRKANRQYAESCYKADCPTTNPVHLIVETSSLCNLKCDFCNRAVMQRTQQNMDLEMWKTIVDQGSEMDIYSISAYALGEPFINPFLREMIVYAKGRGIPYVDVSTNGMFDMRGVVGTGLNEIIISMDKEREEFEKLRKGAKYDNLVSNLNQLIEYREQNKTKWPIIRLQTIKFENDDYDFEGFAKRWLKLVDVVYVKNLEAFSHTLSNKNLSANQIKSRLDTRKPCKQLYFVLTVNSNGDIAYCCHDPKGESVLGDIKDMTLKEAWGKLIKIRENHKAGRYTPICKGCVDYSW